jgi:preprotein translocase subunit SecA
MNQQREAVYRERDGILSDPDILDRTWGIMDDTLSSIIEGVFANTEEPDIRGVGTRLKSIFGPGIEGHLEGVEVQSDLQPAAERMKSELRARFDSKVAELGPENAAHIFRYVLLQVLDASWREHLLSMDELRRGIGLRAIGQKDPLLEYQFESYNLFQETLTGVREKVTEYALRVAVVSRENQYASGRTMRESRNMLLPGSRADTRNFSRETEAPQKQQTVLRGKKTGRNDPCPCGSGKKYKHCCGSGSQTPEPSPDKN